MTDKLLYGISYLGSATAYLFELTGIVTTVQALEENSLVLLVAGPITYVGARVINGSLSNFRREARKSNLETKTQHPSE